MEASKTSNKKDKNKKYQEQISELEIQLAESLAGWQRAKADYLNLKKEMDDKVSSVRQHVKGDLLNDFLPIYENLLTAFNHIPENEKENDWAVGFQHIKSQLEDFFKAQGLIRLETVGEPFDHDIHEAVDTTNDSNQADQIIIKEISPGYLLDDRVIIHPKVVVNQLEEN